MIQPLFPLSRDRGCLWTTLPPHLVLPVLVFRVLVRLGKYVDRKNFSGNWQLETATQTPEGYIVGNVVASLIVKQGTYIV